MEPKNFEQLYPANTRFEEIKKMVEFFRAGRSCQVVGIPGVGKSNVLRLLPYNRKVRQLHFGKDEASFHFIYMDFSEVRGRPIADIVKFIFISLSYSLGERGLIQEQKTVNGFLKEAVGFSDEMILSQGLKRSVDFLAKEKGLYLVFLFDRFEDYIPSLDDKFFLNLKILRNRVKYNFLCAFGVTRPIEDVLENALFGEFHEFIVGNNIFLAIKDDVGLKFRLKHLEEITGKKMSDATRKEIEDLTAGHGKLSKLCFEAALSEPKSKDLEDLFLKKGQIKGTLFEIWNFLTPEERTDVREQTENQYLEKVFLTRKGRLTIPLLKSFVDALPQNAGGGKLIYDVEKNEITKGSETIGEKLTPSEFRLLVFLMTNVGRICEKDEIINAVWRDTKTQEGVTDQALDQIIYRLRKKIEDKPEQPHFIQTIKGRGYKFSE